MNTTEEEKEFGCSFWRNQKAGNSFELEPENNYDYVYCSVIKGDKTQFNRSNALVKMQYY